MARIPVYEERQQAGQGMGVRQVSAPSFAGAAEMGRSLQQVGSALNQMAQAKLNVDEENAKVWASSTSAESELKWTTRLKEMQETSEPGARNFTSNLAKEFDPWADEVIKSAPDNMSKKFLQQSLVGLRRNILSNAISFEAVQGRDYRFNSMKESVEKSARAIYLNPTEDALNRVVGEQEAVIDSLRDTPARKDQLKELLRNMVGESYVSGQIEKDPEAFIRSAGSKAAGTGFNRGLDFIFTAEGGFVAKDGLSGAPANFGINQAANPDIDVKSLTKEQAAEIYRTRYWNPLNAEDLPPQLAIAAFDTAVNMGVGTAKRLLSQSNGDLAKFMELRRDAYNKIVSANPDQSKFLKGWMNRVDKLEKFIGTVDVSDEDMTTIDNPGLRLISPSKIPTVIRQANTQANQARAIYRGEFEQKINDASAMAVNGIPNPENLSLDMFIRAYGADGVKRHQDYQDTQVLANDISSMRTMPIDAVNNLVLSATPKPGPGYDMAAKRHNIMKQAASKIIEMRDKDPAMYVMQSSTSVSQAYAGFTEVMTNASATGEDRKAAARKYANASLSEQERLGIFERNLLSKAAVDSIQKQFISSVDGESTAVKVQAMSEMWGDYWPTVFKQLIKEKALPNSAIVIGSGMPAAAAADLAMASKVPIDTMLSGKTDVNDVKKTINEKVTSQLEDFRATMIGSDGSPRTVGGMETFNVFYDETIRLATYYVSQGMSESDAAKKAAKATITDKYVFTDTYRIPVEFNARTVENGANYALKNLSGNDLLIPETLRRDGFVLNDYAKSIRKNGYWVTSPNEDGIVLFNSESRSPVLNSQGQPIRFTWQQILNIGPEEPSFFNDMSIPATNYIAP